MRTVAITVLLLALSACASSTNTVTYDKSGKVVDCKTMAYGALFPFMNSMASHDQPCQAGTTQQ